MSQTAQAVENALKGEKTFQTVQDRITQLESSCAAMREALESSRLIVHEGFDESGSHYSGLCPLCKRIEKALSTDAGKALLDRLQKAEATSISMPKLMPETAKLVLDFAKALADKLAAAEVKYGYGDSWATPDAEDWPHPKCFTDLVKHLQKGDPRDVAIYCAFLWFHSRSTSNCLDMAGFISKDRLQAVEAERDELKRLIDNARKYFPEMLGVKALQPAQKEQQ